MSIKTNGFTIIELLVAVGVLSLIGGISITVFLALNSSYDKADVVTKINQEGNRVMEQISRAVKNSTDVGPSGSGTNLQLTIPKNASNLEFSTNGNCTQTNIYLFDEGGGRYTVRKSSPAASCDLTPVCPEGANACVLNTGDVNVLPGGFSFNVTQVNGGPDRVVIQLELQQSSGSIADPERQSSLHFDRVALTRGY